MNQGILDRPALERDIEQINYYSTEEKATLTAIFSQMNACLACYQSPNSKLFANEIDESREDIAALENKRTMYTVTIDKAIRTYEDLAKHTTKYFGDIV